jgi:hypothetical protein
MLLRLVTHCCANFRHRQPFFGNRSCGDLAAIHRTRGILITSPESRPRWACRLAITPPDDT